jgi:hypothetical protein
VKSGNLLVRLSENVPPSKTNSAAVENYLSGTTVRAELERIAQAQVQRAGSAAVSPALTGSDFPTRFEPGIAVLPEALLSREDVEEGWAPASDFKTASSRSISRHVLLGLCGALAAVALVMLHSKGRST